MVTGVQEQQAVSLELVRFLGVTLKTLILPTAPPLTCCHPDADKALPLLTDLDSLLLPSWLWEMEGPVVPSVQYALGHPGYLPREEIV